MVTAALPLPPLVSSLSSLPALQVPGFWRSQEQQRLVEGGESDAVLCAFSELRERFLQRCEKLLPSPDAIDQAAGRSRPSAAGVLREAREQANGSRAMRFSFCQ